MPTKWAQSLVVSNASGAIVNKNLYSPFGEIATLAGTTFGFTGQRYDSELGLVYFKRRYMSAKLGRFLQPDPIGYTGKDFNLYTYVDNSPLKLVDPMGTDGSDGQGSTGNSNPAKGPLEGHVNNNDYVAGDCVQTENGSFMVLMDDGMWFNSETGERYFINDDGDFQILPDPEAPENQPQDC